MRSLLLALCFLVQASVIQSKDIPVLSFFIHANEVRDELSWDERFPEIVALIQDYELVGLQDVDEEQLRDLKAALPEFDFVLGPGNTYSNTPVLYRKSSFLLQHVQTFLSVNERFSNQKHQAVLALLYHPESEQSLRLVNTQFEKGPEDLQLAALRHLRKHLLVSSADVNMLMGNFPIIPQDEMYAVLDDEALQDTFHTAEFRCRNDISTYNTFDPATKVHMRVDYIFLNGAEVKWICAEERLKFSFYLSTNSPVFIILSLD